MKTAPRRIAIRMTKIENKEKIANKQVNFKEQKDFIDLEIIYEVFENIGKEEKIVYWKGDFMEQRSLKVLDTNKTFFTKISTTISKLLIPTKVGINGLLISMKRNNVLKAYEMYTENKENDDGAKKEQAMQKYEEAYSLYLEAIDKYIMDSVYKKVKSGAASSFESEALSKYYTIVHLKDEEYVEYKHRKQKYLLELDYDTVVSFNK